MIDTPRGAPLGSTMPSLGRVSTRAPKGSRIALGVFCGVIGLLVWAAYLTFARAAEHHSVIGDFSHPHDLSRKHEPRFGVERHQRDGVASRVGAGSRVGAHHRASGAHVVIQTDTLDTGEVSDTTEGNSAHRVEAFASSKRDGIHGGRDKGNTILQASLENSQPTCGDSKPKTEYWGDVVAASIPENNVETSAECCAKCLATNGCNIWVHCSVAELNDTNAHWCDKQCWLKRVDDPTSPTAHGRGDNVPWTSGSLLKDYDKSKIDANQGEQGEDVGTFSDTGIENGPRFIKIKTEVGDMRVILKPDWHLPSVTFIQRLVTEKGCASSSCHLYRVEPGFLVQGTTQSFNVAANTRTLRGPKIMERGEIGWAGGSAGPDFFVYLGKHPADWLGHDHTVWGILADEDSIQVAEKIVSMDSHTPGGKNTMRFLREKMSFDMVDADEG